MTEDLQNYAERLAEKWVERNCVTHVPGEHPQITAAVLKTNREIYLDGFSAAQEVFELRGRISALREQRLDCHPNSRHYAELTPHIEEAEARLASLLEGKSDE